MNLKTLGGTKFIATIIAQACATVLQWFGKLDSAGNAYMLIVIGTVGAFITGNVIQSKNEGIVKGEEK